MQLKPLNDFQRGHILESLRVISPDRLGFWLAGLKFSDWEQEFSLRLYELTVEGAGEQVPAAMIHEQKVPAVSEERLSSLDPLKPHLLFSQPPRLLVAAGANHEHRALVLSLR